MTTSTTEAGLIAKWIAQNPAKPGRAEWSIKGSRLTAWRIVGQFAVELNLDTPDGYRQILSGGVPKQLIDEVADFYEIEPEAVSAALAYAKQNPELIVARLIVDRDVALG